jgi:hypothetical protein
MRNSLNSSRHLPIVALLFCGLLPVYALATPGVSVDKTRVDFSPPEVMVGLMSREYLVRVTNTGTSPLQLQSVRLGGPDAGDFRLGGCSFPTQLSVGSWCDIQIGFMPLASGPRSAILLVYSDDPMQGRVEITLTGNALAGAPQLAVSPTALDFGLQFPGVPSASQRLTVWNAGTMPLNISTVATQSGEFAIVENCTGVLLTPLRSGGGDCFIDVTMESSVGGPRSATLMLLDPTGAKSVGLVGVVAAPAIEVTPSIVNVARTLGQTAARQDARPRDYFDLPNHRVCTVACSGQPARADPCRSAEQS